MVQLTSQNASDEPESTKHKPSPHFLVDDAATPPPGIIPIGRSIDRSELIGLPISSLFFHAYLCGATGVGKSNLIARMVHGLATHDTWANDTTYGHGDVPRGSVILVDPHGETADAIADAIRTSHPERSRDVVSIDCGGNNPPSMNVLDVSERTEIALATSTLQRLLDSLAGLHQESAPRAVHYATIAAIALCEANMELPREQRFTILDIPRFFTEPPFRSLVMAFSTNDASIAQFGDHGSFNRLGNRQQADQVLPILRAIERIAIDDTAVMILGEPRNDLKFAEWIEGRKIVLLKLRGAYGSGSEILRPFIAPMIVNSLRRRGPDQDLRAILVFDEFHRFADETSRQILTESRRYGLSMIAANQIPSDLPSDVLRSIRENVQTKFVGRLSDAEARSIAPVESEVSPDGGLSVLPSFEFLASIRGKDFNTSVSHIKGIDPLATTGMDQSVPPHEKERAPSLRTEQCEHRTTRVAAAMETLKSALSSG